jgi:hypothetical protein
MERIKMSKNQAMTSIEIESGLINMQDEVHVDSYKYHKYITTQVTHILKWTIVKTKNHLSK